MNLFSSLNKFFYLICTASLAVLIPACSNTAKKLPDFSSTTLNGQLISNKTLAGKITVIKIWATWCGPCRAEIPELNDLVEHYRSDTNVVFVAITDDPKEKIEDFLSNQPFYYNHLTDAKKLKDQLQTGLVQYIPQHLIVNQNGEIIFNESEPPSGISTVLRHKIDELSAVGNF